MKIWMRPLTIFTTLIFILPYILNAQKVEYGVAIDRLISKVQFFHNGKEFYTPEGNFVGSQYNVGINIPVYKIIRLGTELGYNTTRNYFGLMYDYVQNGKTISRYLHPAYLTNEKLYFALLPELRYSNSDFDLFANAGGIIATELSEEYRDFNVKTTNDKWVYGYRFAGGLIFKYKSIGLKFSMGHTVYSKTLLFTDIHPFLQFKNTNIGLGLVFNMYKPT